MDAPPIASDPPSGPPQIPSDPSNPPSAAPAKPTHDPYTAHTRIATYISAQHGLTLEVHDRPFDAYPHAIVLWSIPYAGHALPGAPAPEPIYVGFASYSLIMLGQPTPIAYGSSTGTIILQPAFKGKHISCILFRELGWKVSSVPHALAPAIRIIKPDPLLRAMWTKAGFDYSAGQEAQVEHYRESYGMTPDGIVRMPPDETPRRIITDWTAEQYEAAQEDEGNQDVYVQAMQIDGTWQDVMDAGERGLASGGWKRLS